MVSLIDPVIARQLKDAAMRVSQRNIKQSISEMFSTELKFLSYCFRNYCTVGKLKIPMAEKIAFEKSSPIDWENRKCVICTFLFDADTQGPHARNKMPYMGFSIRKEHIFLKETSIPKELLESTSNLGTLEQSYEVFEKFIKVFTLLNGKYKYRKKDELEDIEDQKGKTFVEVTMLIMETSRIFFQPLMDLK